MLPILNQDSPPWSWVVSVSCSYSQYLWIMNGTSQVRPVVSPLSWFLCQSSLFTLWLPSSSAPSSILTILQTLGTITTIPSLHTLLAQMCVLSILSLPWNVTLRVSTTLQAPESAAFMDSLNQSILEAAFVWSSFWQQTPPPSFDSIVSEENGRAWGGFSKFSSQSQFL